MLNHRTIQSAILSALVGSFCNMHTQSALASGLYQIVSGTFSECCGFAGGIRFSLPNDGQSFVRLTVEPPGNLATMTFLGKNPQTIFSIIPCPPTDPIDFSFDNGIVFSNTLSFQVGPVPAGEVYWNYLVTESAGSL